MKETLEEAARQWSNVHRTGYLGFIDGAKWQQEHGQEVGHDDQVDVIDLIQFLSMDKDFNGYGSVSKETAKYFLDQYKKSKQL
jgi:hypothetical protein